MQLQADQLGQLVDAADTAQQAALHAEPAERAAPQRFQAHDGRLHGPPVLQCQALQPLQAWHRVQQVYSEVLLACKAESDLPQALRLPRILPQHSPVCRQSLLSLWLHFVRPSNPSFSRACMLAGTVRYPLIERRDALQWSHNGY